MKQKEFNQIKTGEYVNHKRYGISLIKEFIPNLGPVIIPCTYNGKLLLYYDSRSAEIFKDYSIGTPYLEDDPKQIELYTL